MAGGPEWDEAVRLLLLMLAPAAPHITEELWSRRLAARGEPWSSIHTERWPEVDPAAVAESSREVPVQVNGKVRDRIVVPADTPTRPRSRPPSWHRRGSSSCWRVATPERVIQAGGGRLVNLVVRE